MKAKKKCLLQEGGELESVEHLLQMTGTIEGTLYLRFIFPSSLPSKLLLYQYFWERLTEPSNISNKMQPKHRGNLNLLISDSRAQNT